jgi:hypothetical protein
MRRFATAFLGGVMLFWAATPLLACAISEQPMTVQERECCEHMPELCGSAAMPASHSCCKWQVQTNDFLVTTAKTRLAPVLPTLTSIVSMATQRVFGLLRDPAEHQPPPKLCDSRSVLRI